MKSSILWLLAGCCFYVGAIFTYTGGGRPLIWGMQLFTGMLMDVVAVVTYKRHH